MHVDEGKFEGCLSFDLISEGQTEVTNVVPDEIEFLRANYDDIHIVEREGFHPVVLLTIDSSTQPTRRVVLEVSIVGGYPFVAPRVRILFPHQAAVGLDGVLSEAEIGQLQTDIRDAISPCLLAGAPCIMQIISVVQRVISTEDSHPQTQATVEIENAKAPAGAEESVLKRDVVKLSVLALHLLNKCCHLKDPESKEEANSNFQLLVNYLLNDARLIPKGLQKCVTWKYEYVKRIFSDAIQVCIDGSDPLMKWMWSHEEGTCTFRRVSAGRYRSEFIEQCLLGSGGFAPVYVCRKKVDGRLYAVKKIAIRKNEAEKALREVQSLAALSHKHIVRYYDAWIEPGCDDELLDYVLDGDEEVEDDCVDGDGSTTHSYDSNRRSTIGGSIRVGGASDYGEGGGETTNTTCYSCSSSAEDDDGEESNLLYDLQSPMHSHKEEEFSTLYIQMELCSKHSLRHLIDQCDKEEGSLLTAGNGDKVATKIFRQLLTVVSHFHRQGIVHRDLKPDNILFEMQSSVSSDDVGTIRVADFGLARTLHRSMKHSPSNVELNDVRPLDELEVGPSPTGNLGSVVYCAPEQERGESYDFSVDEYSLGMIALEMWLAVAGQGFRERFNIMTDISRGKPIPQWFYAWNPRMAEVIASLLERDPGKRRTSEEILNKADLPGDPADVVEALETIKRHGERFSGRVLHCVKQASVKQHCKPPPQVKDAVKALTHTVTLDLIQAVNIIGMLHGAMPLASVDPLVPLNTLLSEQDVSCLIDMNSNVWAFPNQPQLATAYHLTLLTNHHIGSFYHFHYRSRPYAVFTTPSSAPGIVDEMFLDPLLSFFHLLSVAELKSKLEIIVSHADWLAATHSRTVGSVESLDHLGDLCESIEPGKSIGPILDKVDSTLSDGNHIVSSHDRLEALKTFTLRITEALQLFGKQVASNVRVCIDPRLKPAETSVDRSFIDYGVFFECRTHERGHAIAFCCGVENFTSKCGARNADVQAVCLSVDLFALGEVCEHVRFPQTDGLLLSGVAVRPQDVYSPGQKYSALTVSANLWLDNIRACFRIDQDVRGFRKAMKARGIQTLFQVGSQSASISLFHETKMNIQSVDITSREVCRVVRRHCSFERADDPVLYLKDSEKRVRAEEVKKLFAVIKRSLFHILVVDAEAKKVAECVRLYSGEVPFPAADGERSTTPELVEWLKNSMSTYGVLPIFSVPDKTVTFAVDQKLLRTASNVEQKQYKAANRGDNVRRKK
ncbi:protein kinase, putative [Trypanosoma equiperdum]|uniref:Protein kinase, putative n=2 Tax=Trypanozoon TaxID=39700 RepID=Q384V1_TRYB2|nr:protein kinase, putative [Trypanosoma brucei brucei TREU927]EAN79680.1 protein kinase, putative [Trypanosoma brucei brucei TREU927]SCU70820.1 protein kinase, putative [Trypanosoma equiperdum]